MDFIHFLPLLGGQQGAEGAAGGAGAGGLMSFLPFVLIIAVFYFLIIRPQNKKQKETQKMLDSLKKGDKIVTIGGIHGTISKVKEGGTVVVKVADGLDMEFSRSAVASVTSQKTDSDDEADKGKKAKKDEKAQPAAPETSSKEVKEESKEGEAAPVGEEKTEVKGEAS